MITNQSDPLALTSTDHTSILRRVLIVSLGSLSARCCLIGQKRSCFSPRERKRSDWTNRSPSPTYELRSSPALDLSRFDLLNSYWRESLFTKFPLYAHWRQNLGFDLGLCKHRLRVLLLDLLCFNFRGKPFCEGSQVCSEQDAVSPACLFSP